MIIEKDVLIKLTSMSVWMSSVNICRPVERRKEKEELTREGT